MKLLWEYVVEDDQAIRLYIHTDGMYYVQTTDCGVVGLITLPPAKGDELSVALTAGFDPSRMNANDIAAAREPAHPDD